MDLENAYCRSPVGRATFPAVRTPTPFLIFDWGLIVSEIVRYKVDDDTVAQIEIEPVRGFRPAGFGDIAGTVKESVQPAVAAARVLLNEVRDAAPQAVQVKFGIKVTGTANWVVAKAATEANFEVTLTWQPDGFRAAG